VPTACPTTGPRPYCSPSPRGPVSAVPSASAVRVLLTPRSYFARLLNKARTLGRAEIVGRQAEIQLKLAALA
jgi:hypothetical protein